jgi:hypothetical protein
VAAWAHRPGVEICDDDPLLTATRKRDARGAALCEQRLVLVGDRESNRARSPNSAGSGHCQEKALSRYVAFLQVESCDKRVKYAVRGVGGSFQDCDRHLRLRAVQVYSSVTHHPQSLKQRCSEPGQTGRFPPTML